MCCKFVQVKTLNLLKTYNCKYQHILNLREDQYLGNLVLKMEVNIALNTRAFALALILREEVWENP